jgi:hypothetical protein
MMIDMSDIQAVDEVKELILESLKAWKNYNFFNHFIKDDVIPEGDGQVASAVRL